MFENKCRESQLCVGNTEYTYYPVSAVSGSEELPYSLTVLLENVLRCASSDEEAAESAERILSAARAGVTGEELSYSPARVLLQDFTGVPVFVDFAVMREAATALGGDPAKINPQIPCDLVIDHSVIADEAGCEVAIERNMELEFERNGERYTFLKWAQSSFENVRIVPPGGGICHQINVEEFSRVAMVKEEALEPEICCHDGVCTFDPSTIGRTQKTVYFDTVVGTDSHTTTANGIGVLSWGVGGIEAEAAALGQPITTLVPRVIGIELTGELSDGVSAMDLALVFANVLRAKGVVGCFVECFGPGLEHLSATQRACVANMTPEYGCTCTLFPVDNKTIDYLRVTGRSEEQLALIEAYAKAQGFWHNPVAAPRLYSEVISIDLGSVTRNIAGPSRPHDLIEAADSRNAFLRTCSERGLSFDTKCSVDIAGEIFELTHGAMAIAAVTSCTTATDPAMMVSCGLLAARAAEAGLHAKPWVKCVLAPGSKATELLLVRAGLIEGLRRVGFYNCGFGCMSCIGNSGPVLPAMHDVVSDIELTSVLSGNRNFEGRISPDVSQNYLASPALVVAYSLVGTLDFDFENEPLGVNGEGKEVYLADIWPSDTEVQAALDEYVTADLYDAGRVGLMEGDARWQALATEPSATFVWDELSTYVRRAPYFDGMGVEPNAVEPIVGARVLEFLGDFITTDHISPAGSIAADSPAAAYLRERGVDDAMFNTYGSRRGNHEVMMRGTFANVKLQNGLAEGRRGHWTRDHIAGELTSVFDASMHAADEDVPLVVFAGKMYGSGSSRDWAAKGPALLGVRAAFAESFERIHRSNLIGMGILPLQFLEGESAASLGLDGSEVIDIEAIDFSDGLPSPRQASVVARKADGSEVSFAVTVRVDTPTEGLYFANGGILQYVLRNLSRE